MTPADRAAYRAGIDDVIFGHAGTVVSSSGVTAGHAPETADVGAWVRPGPDHRATLPPPSVASLDESTYNRARFCARMCDSVRFHSPAWHRWNELYVAALAAEEQGA